MLDLQKKMEELHKDYLRDREDLKHQLLSKLNLHHNGVPSQPSERPVEAEATPAEATPAEATPAVRPQDLQLSGRLTPK